MADEKYLEGDPDAPSFCLRDLSPFAQNVAQRAALVADLIEADNPQDARCHALMLRQIALSLLQDLEVVPLPEVDVTRTPDTASRHLWAYKGQNR